VVKPDADPDAVDDSLAGPRPLDEEPRCESLPLSDEVPCEGVVVVAADVGDLLDEALVVGFVVGVAGLLGVALVAASLTEPVVGLEPEGHGVAEDSGCVLAAALLAVEGGGSGLVVLPLGLALSLVLVPSLGLELSLPVDGLLGVTSGLGDGLDELGEGVGLDFTDAGADELVFVETGVEADPAGWADVHDEAGATG
jgi:hypothetical protein